MKVTIEPAKPIIVLWRDTTPGFVYQNYPEGSYIGLAVQKEHKAINLAVCLNPNQYNSLNPGELFNSGEGSEWVKCKSNLVINPVVSK